MGLPLRSLPLVVLAAVLALTGCKNPDQNPLQNDPRDPKFIGLLHFDDLPIPNNFVVDRKTSFTYMHGTLRVVTLHMSGLTRAEDVVHFYESQMEIHGWTKRFSLGEPRQRRLEFEKDQDVCVIEVSLRAKTTLVDINVNHR